MTCLVLGALFAGTSRRKLDLICFACSGRIGERTATSSDNDNKLSTDTMVRKRTPSCAQAHCIGDNLRQLRVHLRQCRCFWCLSVLLKVACCSCLSASKIRRVKSIAKPIIINVNSLNRQTSGTESALENVSLRSQLPKSKPKSKAPLGCSSLNVRFLSCQQQLFLLPTTVFNSISGNSDVRDRDDDCECVILLSSVLFSDYYVTARKRINSESRAE